MHSYKLVGHDVVACRIEEIAWGEERRVAETTCLVSCPECGGNGTGPDRIDGPGDVYQDKCGRCDGKGHVGDARVSTVFLGIDHNWTGRGPPLVFETMIFGGEHDQEQWRYSTWAQAEAGHEHAVCVARGEVQS